MSGEMEDHINYLKTYDHLPDANTRWLIYKYPIPITDTFTLSLPDDAKILTLQTQQDVPCLWILHDCNRPKTLRYFQWVGTGLQIAGIQKHGYIGTVQLYQQQLVLHLFLRNH